jgi:putative flippase GtrA
MTATRSALPRQALAFLAIGLVQLALDTAIYVGLTAAGLPVATGNVAGRIAGACLGFWLNGRYTFADGGKARLERRHLLRFILAWCALTVMSTYLLASIVTGTSLQISWFAKPLVEALMAAIGFVVWRQWVYR